MTKKKEVVDLSTLSASEKIKIATQLGEEAGKIMELALKKANTKLKKYGYEMSVDLKFHELDKEVAN